MSTVLPHPYATRNPCGFIKQPLACLLCVCLADRLEVGPSATVPSYCHYAGSHSQMQSSGQIMLALGSLGPHICVFKATKTALRTLTSTEIGITAQTWLFICAILSDRFAQTGSKNRTNLRVGSPDTPPLIMSLRCLGDTEGRLTAVLSQDGQ